MKRSIYCLAAIAATIVATAPAAAAEKLSFRMLEYDQPRDPLVGSNIVFTDVHHSPADQVEPALAALTEAIPAGTSAGEAKDILQHAGAHCAATGLSQETCTYRDLETVDENFDDILWKVQFTTVDDKVTGLTVDRSWQRH